ncbi:MAG: hypothetical protein ACK48G_09550 [Chitinophagaceae bacterium]
MRLGKRHRIISSLHFDEIVAPLFEDKIRSVDFDDLIIPKRAASFKLADILAIERGLKNGDIEQIITVNPDLMVTDGLKRYYAMKRLGFKKVLIQVEKESSDENGSPFTILN